MSQCFQFIVTLYFLNKNESLIQDNGIIDSNISIGSDVHHFNVPNNIWGQFEMKMFFVFVFFFAEKDGDLNCIKKCFINRKLVFISLKLRWDLFAGVKKKKKTPKNPRMQQET